MVAENVAILLTPPGPAAIAVIRLRGPAVGEFLSAHFSKRVIAARCVYGELSEGERVIDDAIVVTADPHTIDLSVHGGPWVVHIVLDLAQRNGFCVPASAPVPLVPEAIDAESELEREALAALPLAKTELAVRLLLAQFVAWEQLKHSPPGAAELRRVLSDPTLSHLLHPPTVAIVGATNVGKSTLANQLFAQERSITADVPGTTRDWVGEIANVNGLPVMLLDTPGLRRAPDAIERAAIERSVQQIERAELVVLVLDAARPLEPEQAPLIREYPAALKVANKSDCAPAWEVGDLDAIATGATSGQGVDRLRRAIVRRFCGTDEISPDRAYCWTSRQRAIIQGAIADPAALDAM